MKNLLPSSSRALIITALLALPLAGLAQSPTGTQLQSGTADVKPENSGINPNSTSAPSTTPSGKPDKAIQRIRTEDSGTRIDEVRVGGETQSITVQPKTGSKLPAYEVKPTSNTRANEPASSTETNGARVWNVLKF